MVKYLAVALFALVALQAALVSARAAGPTTEQSTLDKLLEDAQKSLKDFGEATGLNKLTPEKIIQKIDADAKLVAKNVDAFVDKLKKDVDAKKPEFENLVKKVQVELTKTSEELKKLAGPDATKKAEELKESFEKNVKNAITQVEQVLKAVEPDAKKLKDDLEASGKQILNSIVDGAKKVEGTVKGSLEKASSGK